jgi:hypothetical protein
VSKLSLRFGPTRSRFAPARSWLLTRTATTSLVAAIALCSCDEHTDYSCAGGEHCGCEGNYECFLGCYDDSCDLECSNTSHACGSVCYDRCDATCHDTQECSHACGDGCNLSCYNVEECGAICGADCLYDCHDTNTCGVSVGPRSSLECTNVETCDIEAGDTSTVTCGDVTTCNIECTGSCTVICDQVQSCNLTCLAENSRETHGNGTYSCQ